MYELFISFAFYAMQIAVAFSIPTQIILKSQLPTCQRMEVFTSQALSINYLLIAKSARAINLYCSLRLELARQETANCFFTDDDLCLIETMDKYDCLPKYA